MHIFLGTLFVVVCILLIVVVLLQKGRGGGLGAAFGGAGSSAFGTRTGDVFTWVTIVLTALFLLLAIGTTMYYRPPTRTTPAPTFDPRESDSDTPVGVMIRTRGEAQVYYTVNGDDPEKGARGSIEYDKGKIMVSPGTTIKARAYAEGMDPSEVARAYYGPRPRPPTMPGTTSSAPSTEATSSSAPAVGPSSRAASGSSSSSASGAAGTPTPASAAGK